jgi:hypothetical protein
LTQVNRLFSLLYNPSIVSTLAVWVAVSSIALSFNNFHTSFLRALSLKFFTSSGDNFQSDFSITICSCCALGIVFKTGINSHPSQKLLSIVFL